MTSDRRAVSEQFYCELTKLDHQYLKKSPLTGPFLLVMRSLKKLLYPNFIAFI
jgi:hypothetical protein